MIYAGLFFAKYSFVFCETKHLGSLGSLFLFRNIIAARNIEDMVYAEFISQSTDLYFAKRSTKDLLGHNFCSVISLGRGILKTWCTQSSFRKTKICILRNEARRTIFKKSVFRM